MHSLDELAASGRVGPASPASRQVFTVIATGVGAAASWELWDTTVDNTTAGAVRRLTLDAASAASQVVHFRGAAFSQGIYALLASGTGRISVEHGL